MRPRLLCIHQPKPAYVRDLVPIPLRAMDSLLKSMLKDMVRLALAVALLGAAMRLVIGEPQNPWCKLMTSHVLQDRGVAPTEVAERSELWCREAGKTRMKDHFAPSAEQKAAMKTMKDVLAVCCE